MLEGRCYLIRGQLWAKERKTRMESSNKFSYHNGTNKYHLATHTSNFYERRIFSFPILSPERAVLISFNAELLLLYSWTVLSICTDKPRMLNIGLRDYVQCVLQPFSFSHSYHTSIYWVEVCWRQVQFPSLLRGVIKFSWCWEKEIQCDEHSKTWLPSTWERISTTSKAELPKHLQKSLHTEKEKVGRKWKLNLFLKKKNQNTISPGLKRIKLNCIFQYQRVF